jgi:hypothetical protein
MSQYSGAIEKLEYLLGNKSFSLKMAHSLLRKKVAHCKVNNRAHCTVLLLTVALNAIVSKNRIN